MAANDNLESLIGGHHRKSLFKSGRNVYKLAHASRASFLIDAAAFFRAFAEAAAKAERQIFIVGWDTDSRVELPCPPGLEELGLNAGDTVALGDFIAGLVKLKPDLHVNILSWDFSFIYLFERESLPAIKFSRLDNERIRFVLDREHPALASHHQKIVVIDDEVAFSGGLDLTQRRWDTPEHLGDDKRRVDPGGHAYGPFHDVQICVEGEVARVLGDVVRERWQIATGETVLPTRVSGGSRWPESARVDLEGVEAAISRTLPYGYRDKVAKPVMEVERLFLDAIREAKRFVYIENQYFTAPVIARAIAKRLQEPDGPEFVMVLPRDQTGWIEESTMGLLRSRALRLVEASDHHGRFKCYHPIVPGLGDGYVKVHSKVMVVDDEIVRVGSANMNNRSMGMDTECDVTIEAEGREDVKRSIARLRTELLAEHLGVAPEELAARFEENGSLVRTVESFRGNGRTLVDLGPHVPEWVGKIAPPPDWIDPHQPRGIRRWFGKRIHRFRYFLGPLLVLLVYGLLSHLAQREAAGQFPQGLDWVTHPTESAARVWGWLQSWDGQKIGERLSEFRGNPYSVLYGLRGG